MKNKYIILNKKTNKFVYKCPSCKNIYSLLVDPEKETICVRCGKRFKDFDILNSNMSQPFAKEEYLFK